MSFTKKAILQSRVPLLEARRFRGNIHIQRPRKPHFERQLLIDISKPYFAENKTLDSELCKIGKSKQWNAVIDNPFERILARECLNWFNNSKAVVFLHINSINMEEKSKVYIALRKQGIHLRTYGRKIVGMATEGTHLEVVNKLFTSQQEIIFSPDDQVGKILKILKKTPQLVVLAGIVNNQLLSRTELKAYSQLPNLKTAQAQLCAVLQSAGSGIVSQLGQQQHALVSQLQQHMEQMKGATEGHSEAASGETVTDAQ